MKQGYKSYKKHGFMCYSEIDTMLYYRILNSRLYKNIHDELDLNTFVDYSYDISAIKDKQLRRYLVFMWFDLYGEIVELKIPVDKTSHIELQTLQLDILGTNRRPTNRVYSDSYMPRKEVNFCEHAYG